MGGVFRSLGLTIALVLLIACTGSGAVPASTATPAFNGRPAVITVAKGARLYSDDELHALELKVVTDRDLQAYPLPSVKLAPQTHVEISTQLRTVKIKGIVGADYPLTFHRIRVSDGPARGLEGWIEVGSAE
jgi:hypothetical protein